MINTYVLMIIGLLMGGVGCLFSIAKSVKKKEREDFLTFLTGAIFCSILLFTLGKESNILAYNHPLVIAVRIVIFILGLMMIFAVLFPGASVVDKIEVILDKLRPYITTKVNQRFLLILLVLLAIAGIVMIMVVRPI